MKVQFFTYRKNALNDATIYYVKIIEEAFVNMGYTVKYINKFNEINEKDLVFAIDARDAFFLKMIKPKTKLINWFQGIAPEEALLIKNSRIRKFYLEIFEKYILKNSILSIFVSDAMHKHYKSKYKLELNKNFIMPCFNKSINLSSFQKTDKYNNPTFVYAGSMAEWQCIDETISLFKKIKEKVPNASLTILTKEIELARKKLKAYNVEAEVKYVELEKLDEELSKYKYGFLYRQNIDVNIVSTPTKLNTYIANGVIPIYTDIISAYNNINSEYKILLQNDEDIDSLNILNFESKEIKKENIIESYNFLFNTIFNKERYVKEFSEKIKEI